MRSITIFDTETNGLPANWKAHYTAVNNWPRIIQLAWVRCTVDMKQISRHSYLIKPDGWMVPVQKFWIDNGHSTERCEKEGIELRKAVSLLIEDIEGSDYLVAHNMDFDINIFRSELVRLGVDSLLKPKLICTMKVGTNLCRIPGRYGYKWPKLEELHRYLFNRDFQGAHDALFDVDAATSCLFELIKREHIKLA